MFSFTFVRHVGILTPMPHVQFPFFHAVLLACILLASNYPATAAHGSGEMAIYLADIFGHKSPVFALQGPSHNTNSVALTSRLLRRKRRQPGFRCLQPSFCWRNAMNTLTAFDTTTSGLTSFRNLLAFLHRLSASYFKPFARGKAAITGHCC